MVEFKFVEDKSEDKYLDYVELYNEGLSIKRISEELDVSIGKCNTFYHHAVHEELIKPRKAKTDKKTICKPKYYNYNPKCGYCVYSPLINGKQKSFGTYKTEEEAKFIVEELKKVNWNSKYLNNIRLKAMELFP